MNREASKGRLAGGRIHTWRELVAHLVHWGSPVICVTCGPFEHRGGFCTNPLVTSHWITIPFCECGTVANNKLRVKQFNQHHQYFYSDFIVHSPLADKTQPTVRPICAAVSMVLSNKSQVMAPPNDWILEYESWPWSFIIHVFIIHSTSQCSLFIYCIPPMVHLSSLHVLLFRVH